MDSDLVSAPNLCVWLPLPSSPSFWHKAWHGQGGLRSHGLTSRLNVFPSEGNEASQGLVAGLAKNQLAVPELHRDRNPDRQLTEFQRNSMSEMIT